MLVRKITKKKTQYALERRLMLDASLPVAGEAALQGLDAGKPFHIDQDILATAHGDDIDAALSYSISASPAKCALRRGGAAISVDAPFMNLDYNKRQMASEQGAFDFSMFDDVADHGHSGHNLVPEDMQYGSMLEQYSFQLDAEDGFIERFMEAPAQEESSGFSASSVDEFTPDDNTQTKSYTGFQSHLHMASLGFDSQRAEKTELLNQIH